MNTWAPQETQKTVYALLNGDAQLRTLMSKPAPTQIVFDHVPDGTTYPYITMQIKPLTDRGNHTKEGWACEFQINVWAREPGRGDLDVQNIQYRIDQLLHDQAPCIEGWNVIVLRRTLVDVLLEADNVTRHGVQRFKLYLGEA